MHSSEKEISYQATNTYSTLNSLTSQTQTVWFVCHGMGYLSRYFLKYFAELDPAQNYIIAPQAQSKYYIPPKFRHVGASWLTKENTQKETENVMRYFDAVLQAEALTKNIKLNVVGYSQGVSVSLRYLAKRQLQCDKLLIMSGGIPKELKSEDFKYLNAKIYLTYGTEDEYLDHERITYETQRAKDLFGEVTSVPFEDNHKVNVDLIQKLSEM